MPYDRNVAPCAVEDMGRLFSSFLPCTSFIEAPFAANMAPPVLRDFRASGPLVVYDVELLVGGREGSC